MKRNQRKSSAANTGKQAHREHLRKTAEAVARETPLETEDTRLTLVDVDPHRARAFWSIEPTLLDLARTRAGADAPMILRVYDITGSPANVWAPDQVFDVEVQGLQGSWFVDMWRHERTFVADLGLLTSDGGLVALARSNEISTPPAPEEELVSEPEPETVDEPVTLAPPASPEPVPEAPAISPLENPEPAGVIPEPEAESDPDVEMKDGFPLVFWGASAPEDSTANETVIEALDDQRSSNRTIHEPPSPDALRQPSVDQVMGEVSTQAVSAESDMPDDLQYQPQARAPETPASSPHQQRNSPTPTSLPLQSQVHLSSGESGKKDVLLEVNAELHVYGRAKPNTELSLYGQKVRTRPDGTFSIRKPLPKGALVLPLTYTGD